MSCAGAARDLRAGRAFRLGVFLLLLLTLLVYCRTFRADFLRWDDQFYVTENPVLPDPYGLQKIWDPRVRATQQYYPLTFSSFWLEYRLWGLDARGFHSVNIGLHLASTALAVVVLRSMGLSPWASLFGAGIFALHPAQVASVAWVAERKNVLAGIFSLLCLWAFCRHLGRPTLASYGTAWLMFVAALLSKTQVVGLPVCLLALARVRNGRWGATGAATSVTVAEVALLLVPFALVGLLLSLVTLGYEHAEWTPSLSLVERLLVSTNALVFYLQTLILPFGLSPIYPRWQIAADEPLWWLAPLILATLAGGVIWYRRFVPPLAWWGAVYFLVMLLPVLGVVPFNFFTYSFVADHFLYFSLFGAGAALAAVSEVTAESSRGGWRWLALAGLLLGLSGLSYRETLHWRDNLSFWLRVQQRDPDGFLAAYNLGNHYRQTGQWDLAAREYGRAARIRPRADYAFRRYAEALRKTQGPQAVLAASEDKLRGIPNFAAAFLEKGIALEELGRVEEAREAYRRALSLSPVASPLHREVNIRLESLAAPSSRP